MQSKTPASAVALGGMFAALAVVIMSLGTVIPVATYLCPVICMLILRLVIRIMGTRKGWAWYGAVSILSLLLAPDKEAAAVFLAIGFYPILKPGLDQKKLSWLWKGLLFNSLILILYWVLLKLIGMDRLVSEFSDMGIVMTVMLLVMGNITFFMLDRLLGMKPKIRKQGRV